MQSMLQLLEKEKKFACRNEKAKKKKTDSRRNLRNQKKKLMFWNTKLITMVVVSLY